MATSRLEFTSFRSPLRRQPSVGLPHACPGVWLRLIIRLHETLQKQIDEIGFQLALMIDMTFLLLIFFMVTIGGIQVSEKTVASQSGFIGMLQAAGAMNPDAAFIITDRSYKSKVHTSGIPWDEIRKVSDQLKDSDGRRTKINVIDFEACDEDLKQIKRMSQSSGSNPAKGAGDFAFY